MATIDLSLDALKIPALDNFTPDFGTMITETQANKGGLSTFEVNSNMMLPWAYMRPKVVVEDSVTTVVEYDAKLTFSASLQAGVTLTMDAGDYEGCEVSLRNLSAYACTVEHGTFSLEIPAGGFVRIIWNGTTWEADVSSAVGSGIILPPTAAAVDAAIDNLNFVPAQSNPSYNALKSSAGWTASQACILCGNIQPNAGNSIVTWYVNGEKVSQGGTNDAPYNSSVCFPVPKNGKVTVDGDSTNNNFFCSVFYFTH